MEEIESEVESFRLGKKYDIPGKIKNKLQTDYPEIIDLINSLHKYIKKQAKKLKNLKKKFKEKKKNQINRYIQTENNECTFESAKSITEEITQAAELAVQNSGFVFEETSGLYYDYSTGYYYNAELGLYYDGNTGTYMTYNSSENSYKFHSKVDIVSENTTEERRKYVKKTKRKKQNREKNQDSSKRKCLSKNSVGYLLEIEEGECSDTESAEEDSLSSNENEGSDHTKLWPPCIRIIIESSNLSKLKIGSLYIVTYEGGSLGREGDHSILIPDINTSKYHLKFTFDKESNKFFAIDMGSRNGTLLNGKRMSASKQESETQEVAHGSRIQIGSTVLLCHIHKGNETCGLCEPGLLSSDKDDQKSSVSTITKEVQHKKELKRLRQKFGIVLQDNSNVKLPSGYSDRAQTRRETIGSHNEFEKTEVASVDESIKPTNIGFKLLSKMGWSEGEALGKEGSGISEPIQAKPNLNNAGLGSETATISLNKTENPKKGKILKKTQERFQQLPSTTDMFQDSDY